MSSTGSLEWERVAKMSVEKGVKYEVSLAGLQRPVRRRSSSDDDACVCVRCVVHACPLVPFLSKNCACIPQCVPVCVSLLAFVPRAPPPRVTSAQC